MVKVHGSRMVGSLLTPSRTFAVFNGMDAVPTFDTQIEQRGKIMLQNIRYTRTGVSHTPDGILLSDQWAVMATLLEVRRSAHTQGNSPQMAVSAKSS